MSEQTPDKQQYPAMPVLKTSRIAAGQKSRRKLRGVEIVALAALVALIGAGAAVAAVTTGNRDTTEPPAAAAGPAAELRLGYFANVTHAPALIGVNDGILAKHLGATDLKTQVFNAGPSAIEALNAGAIDAAYLGPNPAINSFVKSGGESIRIIAGATSGGAQLVVRPEITSATQLRGKVLATPQLGGTQDVALRSWLAGEGLATTPSGGGDVAINPTDNASTLKLFQEGKLDGAWLPEPWASRLVLQAGAKVLINEADLWEDGDFATTILIVSKAFLDAHPETVDALLAGNTEAIDWLNAHPQDAATAVNAALKAQAGKELPADVIDRSLSELKFTPDPLARTFPKLLQDGVTAGVGKQADLSGIFALKPLNRILEKAGTAEISAGGLD
ncbi:aliphatic sulfonate ABC transporter periplasmic substrate-binding protein [Arthrobacter sp. PAMC 25486]|uniref:ABC transporter substrate-binding protein n=1 Tax=Arthrobacter sp. PAMC 25486 TaxID=1494608 RepID=UPI000535F35D|nr:ABC transporter substrate-binding protein [Arthrobacter sp. PAMC 25486]AIY01868.1 aliphatic sulfonate ABC transporter periplasmic substrate-binding protein [Arthrobacter sp. PAMC 25486]